MKNKERRPKSTPLDPPLSGGKQKLDSLSSEMRLKGQEGASHDKGRSGGVGCSANIAGLPGNDMKVAFLPYDKNLTALSRKNRKNPTKAEWKMWNEVLRMRQFSNSKFLRQKPLAGYIVDFFSSELRLVIEIDGSSHADVIEYDAARTQMLNALGLTVVRYSNEEVLQNIEGVVADLLDKITQGAAHNDR